MKLEIGQPKSITIKSRNFWNDTDIEVHSGEEYHFEADGTWRDFLEKTDANGYTNKYMSLYNRFKRSKENKWFALIGSLNKTNDFLIGKKNQIPFHENGMLQCYANDVRGFYWNNFGNISLTITRLK